MAFSLPFRLPFHVGPRTRRVLRYVGISVLGLVAFVFALQMTLPFERAKDRLIELASPQYDITIGSIERGWIPGRVYLNAVSIRTRPTKPEETPTVMYIERFKADLGILALIGGNLSLDLDAKIGTGHIAGNIELYGFGRKGLAVHVTGRQLPASSLPMRGLLGLPMSGKLEFDVALDLPNETTKAGKLQTAWAKADGEIELACPTGCTFGDGKTKLKPLLKNRSQQVMVQDGIDFGKLEVTTLLARVEIKNNAITVTKFDTTSQDGELHVDFKIPKIDTPLDESIVDGCLRFKGSEGLAKREPKTYAALTTTGAELRGDGLFHIKLANSLKEMARLNAECGPNAKPEGMGTGTGAMGIQTGIGRPQRPNLTVMPEGETRPPVPPTAVTPPIIPPPPPQGSGVGSGSEPGGRAPEREREGQNRRVGPEGETGSGSANEGSQNPPPATPTVPPGNGTAGAGAAGQVLQKR